MAPCGPLAWRPVCAGSSRCAATRQNSPAAPVIPDSALAGPNRQVASRPARSARSAPDRRLARQPERVRQCAVRQPRDVPQPVRVGPVRAEWSGDVQAVRPVLGQPGRGQRGGLHRPGHPLQRSGPDRPPAAPPARPPARAAARAPPPAPPSRPGPPRLPARPWCRRPPRQVRYPGPAGDRGLDRFLGLRGIQHHVGDRPAFCPEADRHCPSSSPARIFSSCSCSAARSIKDAHAALWHTDLPAVR